jgi:hypothetical protein
MKVNLGGRLRKAEAPAQDHFQLIDCQPDELLPPDVTTFRVHRRSPSPCCEGDVKCGRKKVKKRISAEATAREVLEAVLPDLLPHVDKLNFSV